VQAEHDHGALRGVETPSFRRLALAWIARWIGGTIALGIGIVAAIVLIVSGLL
jgi:hypothetical protein